MLLRGDCAESHLIQVDAAVIRHLSYTCLPGLQRKKELHCHCIEHVIDDRQDLSKETQIKYKLQFFCDIYKLFFFSFFFFKCRGTDMILMQVHEILVLNIFRYLI